MPLEPLTDVNELTISETAVLVGSTFPDLEDEKLLTTLTTPKSKKKRRKKSQLVSCYSEKRLVYYYILKMGPDSSRFIDGRGKSREKPAVDGSW